MASSTDVVKKVMRLKLQLTDTAESVTVLNILQKLKDLEITLDILAETGIGKTVNSLRRHDQAGEFAKSLVRGWKRLVPKESTSHSEDGDVSQSLSLKDELEKSYPNNESLTTEDLNNNCLTSLEKSQNSSDKTILKTGIRKADSEKRCEGKHKDHNESQEESPQENYNVSQNDILIKKTEIQEDKMDNALCKEEKNYQRDRKSGGGLTLLVNKTTDNCQKKSSFDREKAKSSPDDGGLGSDRESNKKPKTSEESFKVCKEFSPFESNDKYSKTSKGVDITDDRSSGMSRSSGAQNRKRKKTCEDRHADMKYKEETNRKGHSKHKKVKIKQKDERKSRNTDEPSMSFESYMNYDIKRFKKNKRSGLKKPVNKVKTTVEEERRNYGLKDANSPAMSMNVTSPNLSKESLMDLMNIPLPTALPEWEKPSGVEHFDRKIEKESDFYEFCEESSVFTGQRLNKKMQVYSGAKTIFLPSMMSLHQQCIRTLQNNINLLYETGGVPFEILEPVLERCTPEQLLRIEDFNPIYIGVTDHLWGRHCERDFKDSKLEEYESWKEMFIRLSEERERKLQRLTKTIVSAHSKKPKGRQVKMAFIHTVAKPPRDVRIQQEIHGTAVQQPQIRCSSVKVQENRSRSSCNESSRSSSTTSGQGNTQDPRKKTRVAPMMAKSLKAFKKQFGRR